MAQSGACQVCARPDGGKGAFDFSTGVVDHLLYARHCSGNQEYRREEGRVPAFIDLKL